MSILNPTLMLINGVLWFLENIYSFVLCLRSNNLRCVLIFCLQPLPKSHTEQDTKRKRDITASEAMENHLKVPKREKNLMQKAADIDFNDKCSANSDDQLIEKISKASDQPPSNITLCGFCQSAMVSEVKP